MRVYLAVVQRDLRLAYRSLSQVLNPLLFFLMTVALFPLGISPSAEVLSSLAPGIIWIAALLATLLTLDGLYRTDFEDGSLHDFLLAEQPLSVLILCKVIAHWMITGLPLLIISPLACYLLFMSADDIVLMMITLLLGTPILSLIGSIHMALTVGLGRGNLLLAILTIPFYVPVLIFATAIVDMSRNGLDTSGHFLLLAAMLVLSLTLAPLASALALRVSVET